MRQGDGNSNRQESSSPQHFAALREITAWLFVLGFCGKEKLQQSSQLGAAAAVDMRATLSLFESLALFSHHFSLLHPSQRTNLQEWKQEATFLSVKSEEIDETLSAACPLVDKTGSRTSWHGASELLDTRAEASEERGYKQKTVLNTQVADEIVLQTGTRDAVDSLKEVVALITTEVTKWLPYTGPQQQARVQRALDCFVEAQARWTTCESDNEKALPRDLHPTNADTQHQKAGDGRHALTDSHDEKRDLFEKMHSQSSITQHDRQKNRIRDFLSQETPPGTRAMYALTQAVLMGVPTRKIFAALKRARKIVKR